jgi:hypothetical protein
MRTEVLRSHSHRTAVCVLRCLGCKALVSVNDWRAHPSLCSSRGTAPTQLPHSKKGRNAQATAKGCTENSLRKLSILAAGYKSTFEYVDAFAAAVIAQKALETFIESASTTSEADAWLKMRGSDLQRHGPLKPKPKKENTDNLRTKFIGRSRLSGLSY